MPSRPSHPCLTPISPPSHEQHVTQCVTSQELFPPHVHVCMYVSLTCSGAVYFFVDDSAQSNDGAILYAIR